MILRRFAEIEALAEKRHGKAGIKARLANPIDGGASGLDRGDDRFLAGTHLVDGDDLERDVLLEGAFLESFDLGAEDAVDGGKHLLGGEFFLGIGSGDLDGEQDVGLLFT